MSTKGLQPMGDTELAWEVGIDQAGPLPRNLYRVVYERKRQFTSGDERVLNMVEYYDDKSLADRRIEEIEVDPNSTLLSATRYTGD